MASDAEVAPRVLLDQRPSRLPAHVAPLPEGPEPATGPIAARSTTARSTTERSTIDRGRLPRGAVTAGAAASTLPLDGPPIRRRGSGIGRVFLWLTLLGILPVLLAATAAYLAAAYLDEQYGGRSEIMFHLPELAGDAANRFLATQPVVARSFPVVGPVAQAEAMPVEDLLANLDTTLVQGSTLMRIEYHDVDAERILRVLEGLTTGYLALLRDIALIEGASHRILSAPYLLEDPVSPRPIRAAAIGAVVGLAVAFAGLVILAQLRRPA